MTNKAWGGRFKKSLDPRVVKFNSSLSFDHLLFQYDIKGSQVHAEMLARQGIITTQEAELICKTLEEIKAEIEQSYHVLDDTYEDIHMFIEHLLVKKIGDVGKKLHTGRSRNDQVALDLRLYSKEVYKKIKELLSGLIETLGTLADKYKHDPMPGYTHLQQAQPITLGKHLGAYHSMFSRDLGRLEDWHERMNFSPLGAGALAGSSLPLDREWVAQKLGFSGVIGNTLDAVSDRDYIVEFGSFASITMMHLSRMAEDMILWATQEFNFVTLDDAFATGSSLMPNKKNPDVLELIRGKCGRVFGQVVAILTVMKGMPLAYNKDMQEDKEEYFDSVNTLATCLEVITPFLQSLEFNLNSMKTSATSGFLEATAILEDLVREGMPFREAHHTVGSWVSEAMEKGTSLKDIAKSYKENV